MEQTDEHHVNHLFQWHNVSMAVRTYDNEQIKAWTYQGPKWCWITKQVEPFCIHSLSLEFVLFDVHVLVIHFTSPFLYQSYFSYVMSMMIYKLLLLP